MHRWLFLWICLWPLVWLMAAPIEYQEPKEVTATEGLPSSLVNQSVCVISGEYTEAIQDLVLPGPEPLILQRFYGNKSRGSLGRSWSFNHGEALILGDAIYDKKESVWIVGLRQPSGAQLDYIHPRSKDAQKKKRLHFQLIVPKGLTNGATSLSGRTNLRNQEVYFYPDAEKIVSISGAGNRRTFTKIGRTDDGWPVCGQQSEEKVNGSLYKYEGRGKDWDKRITCKSAKTGQLYSSVKFNHAELSEHHPLTLTTSDGRRLKYFFKRHKFKVTEGDWHDKNTSHFESYYLTKVDHSYAPEEHYEYKEKALSKELQIVCKRRPDHRFLQTEYYHKGKSHVGGQVGNVEIERDDDYRLDRVKKQKAPVGTDQKPITTHRFVYHCKVKKHKKDGFKQLFEGTTDVYDAYHHYTQYAYDEEHRLTSILRHTGISSYAPYSSECFLWEKESNLLGRILKDGQGNVHQAHYFTYDKRGNVLTSSLCGRLTGLPAPGIVLNSSQHPIENGYESERKTYTYSEDGLNLVLSETDSRGKAIVYHYIPGTDQVKAKYVMLDGQIQLREFYSYDDHYVLIQKIKDDGKHLSPDDLMGVTERHFIDTIPRQSRPLGLPESVEESCFDFATGQKQRLRSLNFHYSPEGRLLKQEIFDANHQLAYTLSWEYDDHGNLTRETNALGETITKKYDANNNLIFQQGPSADFYIQNTYDFVNRLIRQEEIHTDGKHFTTAHTYDYLGNCIATMNPYGHETRQTFDDFGRVVATQYSAVLNETGQLVHPIVSKTYDIAGYPICLTDAKGRKTQTEYNIRGQPTQVIHPDGTREQWIYQIDGQLAQKITKNGTRTVFTRDPLGRVTEEAVYAADGQLLKRMQNIYNALHLLQSIDSEGGVTTYSYDAAGRLEWTRQGDRRQQNFYDSLGRLAEVREWFGDQQHEYRATIKVYDLLDRVIEERLQTSNGVVLHLSRYAYDARGNRTLAQVGEEKTWTEYDAHNNPVKITNGLGHATHTVYNTQWINPQGQRVLQTTTTDPLGYQTIHTYDTANRLVETKRCNPFGFKVACQSVLYDLCGNRCRISEEVIEEGQTKRVIETLYSYSDDNQVTMLIEAAGTPEQKISRTSYNPFGQKESVFKPDGTILMHEYDVLGRLKALKSSEGSICYLYDYNWRDQVTRVQDLRWNRVTECAYDSLGQLIREALGNGLSLQYTYDKTGRARTILFPDQTGVEYVYDAVDLREVHRLAGGQRIYSHADQSHTLAGQVTRAKLPGNNGEVEYDYNALGRCTKVQAVQFQQLVPVDGLDAAGNVLKFQAQGTSYHFTYDDHYHLKSETGHTHHSYQFDSLSNRTLKDGEGHVHNALNQIVQRGEEQFSYDANGNLIRRVQGGKAVQYVYDALDRLIAVTQEGRVVHYFYDSFNRRLMKQQEGQEEELFIYQGQEEVGRWKSGAFQELRLMGKNKRNPMVALEIKGKRYVPLHDLSGNVVCLLDHQGQAIERYRYTAFGESEILAPSGEVRQSSVVGNPWQYASKRLDEETGLVAFGMRYYEPRLGRWITPDPVGYADGSNLYAYVHNSPLLYYDQFGLYKNLGITGLYGHYVFDFAYSLVGMGYQAFQSFDQSLNGAYGFEVSQYAIEDELFSKYKPLSFKDTFERTAIHSVNGSYTDPSTKMPFQLRESADKGIGFHHGIQNTRADFDESFVYIAQMSKYNVKGVYTPCFGIGVDLRCYLNAIRKYEAYEPVRELHKMWNDFFKNCPINATFLMICHSRGAAYVKIALMSYPVELRQRIEVIAIAPGGYIDPHLCKSIKHYESNADVIPLADLMGRQRCKDTIVTLEPHPKANPWSDHSFMSPTYTGILDRNIKEYLTR